MNKLFFLILVPMSLTTMSYSTQANANGASALRCFFWEGANRSNLAPTSTSFGWTLDLENPELFNVNVKYFNSSTDILALYIKANNHKPKSNFYIQSEIAFDNVNGTAQLQFNFNNEEYQVECRRN